MKKDFWEDKRMNIQIFGYEQVLRYQKAQRYFKEQGHPVPDDRPEGERR